MFGEEKPSHPWNPLPLDLVTQERPTFPRFCFTLNLAKADRVKKKGIWKLKIAFKGIQDLKFIVIGRTLYCKRNIKEQNVFSSGKPIKLDKGERLEYLIQIKENIFLFANIDSELIIASDSQIIWFMLMTCLIFWRIN